MAANFSPGPVLATGCVRDEAATPTSPVATPPVTVAAPSLSETEASWCKRVEEDVLISIPSLLLVIRCLGFGSGALPVLLPLRTCCTSVEELVLVGAGGETGA